MNTSDSGIVYIAGYGRSGSTLLDIILGNHSEITSMGEVGNFWSHSTGSMLCTCGTCVCECSIWSDVLRHTACYLPTSKRNPQWRGGGKQQNNRVQLYRELFSILRTRTNTKWLVDSSKTSYSFVNRPVWLCEEVKENIKLIHIQRSLLAVVGSKKRGNNKQLRDDIAGTNYLASIRAVIGWFIANIAALRCGRKLGRDCYLAVSYENLCNQPISEIITILDWLGLDADLEPLLKKIRGEDKLIVSHMIEGNRVARAHKDIMIKAAPIPKGKVPLYIKVVEGLYANLCKLNTRKFVD